MRILVISIFSVFYALGCFSAGLRPFQDKDTELWGLKNAKGKVICKPQFQGVVEFNGPLIAVFKNNHVYRLDQTCKIRFESVFFDNGPDYYEEGLSRFIENGKVGFHDDKGNIVIKANYDFARGFKNGTSVACEGCWAVSDPSAKFQPMSSGGCPASKNDHHAILKGGKWGAINKKGETVVPFTLGSIEEVDEQLAKR